MQESYNPGDMVLATAGRDAKRIFIVLSVIDELYVYIANGKSRRVETPKKKKIKHLVFLKKADEEINLKNGKYTNAILRKMIEDYKKLNSD